MRRVSNWLYLIFIAPLAYFLFMPVYYSKTQDQTILQNYLMGGFILVTVLVFMIDQIIQNHRIRKENQRNHSTELNEIYKRLVQVGFSVERSHRSEVILDFPRNYYIDPRPFISDKADKVRNSTESFWMNTPLQAKTPFNLIKFHPDYQNFDFAIEHLKNEEYENIYKHWESIGKIIEEFSNSKPVLDKLKSELDVFSKELQILVTELKSGKLIKGKCSRCP